VSGVLVPERDDEELAFALLDAARDRDFLARLARAGAEAVQQDFDQQRQVRRLEDIYLETIR
jgi:glycosyltransferase involved in cell wall biosynthesis